VLCINSLFGSVLHTNFSSEYGVSKGLSEYDFFLFHHLNLRWNLFRESDGARLLFLKKIRVEFFFEKENQSIRVELLFLKESRVELL
jgi:hypothetical protein